MDAEQLQTYIYLIGAFAGLIFLFQFVCLWIIYTKAGQPGWATLVPFYNYIVLMRIIGKSDWYWLRLIIPCIGIFFIIPILNGLSKSFGKGAGFTVGLIFFPVIFFAILAFGSEY